MAKKKQGQVKKPNSKQLENLDSSDGLLGNKIRELRKERGISLGELSRQSGVDKGILSRLEAGESEPTLKTLRQLAKGLMVSLPALLANEKDEITYSLNLASVELALRSLIEKQRQSLQIAESLLAEIHKRPSVQPQEQQPEQQPVIRAHIRKVEL